MKRIYLILACLVLFSYSCKKGEEIPQDNRKVSYSYGNYNEKDAIVTAQLEGEYLSITIGPASSDGDKGGINIQLDEYTGPGTYTFNENLRVVADKDDQEAYWENFYYNDAGKVYGAGELTIKKLTDEFIEASVQGKLYHLNGQSEIVNTDLKASINSYR